MINPPINTKFKQGDKVRITKDIFGDNGWAVANKGEIKYVYGFNNVPIDRELVTIYLLLSQDFYENKLGKSAIENYPDDSDVVLVREHEIELIEEQNGIN